MTRDSSLAVQLADLRSQVAAAKEVVEQLPALGGVLHHRVSGLLAELVEDCDTALREAEAALDGADAGAGWGELRARKAARLLSRESLAFTEGALVRRERLDGGVCELADKLLDDLNERGGLNWRGFSILAETASDGEVGDVIRLRFPEVSVWHLPIACHELGHVVNPRIRVEVRERSYRGSTYPVEEYLEAEWKKGEKPWFWAHEYLADVFAVYAAGPAYMYCSLLLHSDPVTIGAPSPRHPSWNERFFLMVETLRRISFHGGTSQQIVSDLVNRWNDSRSAAKELDGESTDRLRATLETFYPLLHGHLGGVRYTTFGKAQQLVPMLADGDEAANRLAEVRLVDVINAAWLARLDDLGDSQRAEEIGRRALEICQAL